MSLLQTLFVNWSNGAFIMTIIFGLVIISLVGFVIYFINSAAKKEREAKQDKEKA
jgi:heme/copper-type cytochrome/quinol oxidase subunit 2